MVGEAVRDNDNYDKYVYFTIGIEPLRVRGWTFGWVRVSGLKVDGV